MYDAHVKQGSNQSSTKIEELESIRGLAALLVVFFHIPKWNSLLDIGIINNGYLMVELFFVLSGFVIYNAYAKKIISTKDLIRFQFLRFGRLYPVHLLFLVVYIFIEVAKYFAQYKFGISSPNSQPFLENNLAALFQHIFLIQAIGPTGNDLTFNGPAWSISVEFFTYLLFGVGVLFFHKNKEFFFSVLALISLLMLTTETTFGFSSLVRCFAGFFIGCLTANIIGKSSTTVPSYISLLIFVAIFFFLQIKTPHEYDLMIYFLSSTLIASLVLSKQGLLKKILNLKILTWLGSISYAVYMSHSSIIWVMNQVVRIILKKPELIIDGQSIPQLSEIDTLIGWILIVVLVLLVSKFVLHFIEKPLRKKSRHFAFTKLN
tara:strand:- start:769 stop:1896 length:1128 start_codon:yes stop_codon:yes gene_type:complete